MEIETLKRSHLKRNVLIGVLAVGVISAIVLNFTRARYRVTESIPLVNGTINYTPGDIIISAYYNGELMDTFPTKDSGYTVESITCDNNATVTFNEDTWSIKVNNLVTRATKCDVYFEEKPLAREIILANKDIQERTDFSTALTSNTNGIIYQEETSDGTTYYFAGDTDENWVSFAGYYWRIIRINEDGSIRMIYNGATIDPTGNDTQLVEESSFNGSWNNNMYVGYMYTRNQVHGLGTDSTIKEVVDTWYEDNIQGNPVEDLISTEAGFCGDRSPYSRSGSHGNMTYVEGGGTGTTDTYYGAVTRLYYGNAVAANPTFECPNETNDLYTIAESSKGNHALDYPVGLITADEAVYAGGVAGPTSNSRYYLYTSVIYWTMSPYSYDSFAYVFEVNPSGGVTATDGVDAHQGVRPVINLRADVQLTGSGTSTDPYVVEGAA